MSIFHNAIITYKKKGLHGLIQKSFRYLLNWRQIFGDLKWYAVCLLTRTNPTVLVNDRKMCLHRYEAGISRELFIYRVHEPATSRLLSAGFVQEGMMVVDIGANIGYYTFLEADLVGPNGTVVAIEPEPANHDLLLHNIRLNNTQNIVVVPPCAVGPTDGRGRLYLGGSASWHSLLVPGNGNLNYIDVRTYKLDSLLEEMKISQVDLIRMDVEGFEIHAKQGMWLTLQKFKPRLLIELHYDLVGIENINQLLLSLKTLGYHALYLFDRDLDMPPAGCQDIKHHLSIDEIINISPPYRVAMGFFTAEVDQ